MQEMQILKMELEFLYESRMVLNTEITTKEAQLRALEDAAAEVDNPFWFDDGDDVYGGRYSKPVDAIKETLLAGNRGERCFAKREKVFNCKFVVTLSNDAGTVSPELLKMYKSEQAEQFAFGVIGGAGADGIVLDYVNRPEGGENKSYLIPWAGNSGPVVARERFEMWWTAPHRLKQVKAQAETALRKADFEYYIAGLRGTENEFLAENSWYEAP